VEIQRADQFQLHDLVRRSCFTERRAAGRANAYEKPGNKCEASRQRASGFSLIEMTMVVALIIILASITFISLVPVMKQQRVTNAYNTTLAAMRQARDNAVAQRTSYSVTFQALPFQTPSRDADAARISGRSEYDRLSIAYGYHVQRATNACFHAASGQLRIRAAGY